MAKLTEIEQLQKKKKRKQMGKNILVLLIAAAVVCAALYLRNSSDFQEFLPKICSGYSTLFRPTFVVFLRM